MQTTQEQSRRNDAKLEIRNFIRENASDSSSMIERAGYLIPKGPGIILRMTTHLEVSINLYMTGKVSFYLYSRDVDGNVDTVIRGGLKLPSDNRFVLEWHKPRKWTKSRFVCYVHCVGIDWRRLSKANLETLTHGYDILVSALNKIKALR